MHFRCKWLTHKLQCVIDHVRGDAEVIRNFQLAGFWMLQMVSIDSHPFVVVNREGKLRLQEFEKATILHGEKEIIFCIHLCLGDELVIANTKIQQFFGLGTKKIRLLSEADRLVVCVL